MDTDGNNFAFDWYVIFVFINGSISTLIFSRCRIFYREILVELSHFLVFFPSHLDVRAEYSQYDRANVLTIDYRTIITENPTNSQRANDLLVYARDHKTLQQIAAKRTGDDENVDQITEVMTVQKVLDQLTHGVSRVAVIIFGVLSKFETDPEFGASPVVKACSNCNRYLANTRMQCTEVGCVAAQASAVDRFRILAWISDHTGTISCRINDEYANSLLKFNATAFKQLPESMIEQIKKRFVLQRFAIKVIVKPKQNSDYTASIVAITPTDPSEIAANLRTY